MAAVLLVLYMAPTQNVIVKKPVRCKIGSDFFTNGPLNQNGWFKPNLPLSSEKIPTEQVGVAHVG